MNEIMIGQLIIHPLLLLIISLSLTPEVSAFAITYSSPLILRHPHFSKLYSLVPKNECGPYSLPRLSKKLCRITVEQNDVPVNHACHKRYQQCRHSISRMASRGETINTGLRRAEQWRNKGKVVWNVERKMKSTPPIVHVLRFILVAFVRAIAVAWIFRAVQRIIPSLRATCCALSNISPEGIMTLPSCAFTVITSLSANILLLLRGSRIRAPNHPDPQIPVRARGSRKLLSCRIRAAHAKCTDMRTLAHARPPQTPPPSRAPSRRRRLRRRRRLMISCSMRRPSFSRFPISPVLLLRKPHRAESALASVPIVLSFPAERSRGPSLL
jgi:hypothetical protein